MLIISLPSPGLIVRKKEREIEILQYKGSGNHNQTDDVCLFVVTLNNGNSYHFWLMSTKEAQYCNCHRQCENRLKLTAIQYQILGFVATYVRTHTHIRNIYTHTYVCVHICVCIYEREREVREFSVFLVSIQIFGFHL